MSKSVKNELGTFEYLLSIESKNYEVVGVERVAEENDLKVSLKCKSCGEVVDIHLRSRVDVEDDKVRAKRARRIVCKNCGKPEYLVTDVSDDLVRAFAIKSRREYEKWKLVGYENGEQ